MERFDKGLETLKKYVTEEEATQLVSKDTLASIAPDLRKLIVEFAYGDIYSRDGLDERKRALVVISSVVTQGALPQIKTHVARGLQIGLSATEIVEAMMQLIPYIGFPRVQNALTVVKQLFEEKDIQVHSI
jgi:4-carboxymuconolactone decarboxylase